MFDFLKKVFSKDNPKKKITVEIKVTKGYSDKVEELLQEATAQKKEKNYAKACLLLTQAYELGSDTISLKDKLRLPMYLQLANQNDEGWQELSMLFNTNLGAESQHIIANQKRIFLYKEKKFLPAVPHGIYSYIKQIEQYRNSATRKRQSLENNNFLQESYSSVDDETKKYYDGRWQEEKISNLLKSENIENEVFKLLKKAKKEFFTEQLTTAIKEYVNNNTKYQYLDIDKICKKILL